MKKGFFAFLMFSVPSVLFAQTTSTIFKKGTGKDTTIFFTLYRGEVPAEKKIEFSIVYNYMLNGEKRQIDGPFYILEPGVNELTVSRILPTGAYSPWLNGWATTKSYFELPMFIGRIPVLQDSEISRK